MIWVAIVGLAVGALLAQRFKIIVLLPATVAFVLVALVVARTQIGGASSTILIVVVTNVSMQVGYFVGMLVRGGMGGASRLTSISRTTSTRGPVR